MSETPDDAASGIDPGGQDVISRAGDPMQARHSESTFHAIVEETWPLTPRNRFIIYWGLQDLAFFIDDELAGIHDSMDQVIAEAETLTRFPLITRSQSNDWWQEINKSADMLVERFRIGRDVEPRNVAEEVLLYLTCHTIEKSGLADRKGYHDTLDALPARQDDVDLNGGDWVGVLGELTGDLDVTFLWDPAHRGQEDPRDQVNQALGIGDYRPSAWFNLFHRTTSKTEGDPKAAVVGDQLMLSPETMAKLWGVVMTTASWSGGRYLWSPDHQSWQHQANWGWSGSWQLTEDHPKFELEDVTALHAFATRSHCFRCGLGPDQHLVAPDPWNKMAWYCVQMPTPTVVGGNGEKKHVGSATAGCQSVDWDWLVSVGHRGPEMHVRLRPGPLVASEIRDRAWCSRCGGGRSNSQDESRYHEAQWALREGKVFWDNSGLATGLRWDRGAPDIYLPDGTHAKSVRKPLTLEEQERAEADRVRQVELRAQEAAEAAERRKAVQQTAWKKAAKKKSEKRAAARAQAEPLMATPPAVDNSPEAVKARGLVAKISRAPGWIDVRGLPKDDLVALEVAVKREARILGLSVSTRFAKDRHPKAPEGQEVLYVHNRLLSPQTR